MPFDKIDTFTYFYPLSTSLVMLSQQYLDLRMKKHLGQLKNPSEIRTLHKDIARIHIALSQKNSK